MAGTYQENETLAAIVERVGGADLAGSLRPLIRSLLSEGRTHAEQIAQRAGMSSRSLQRYLAQDGHTFSELLRQTRLEMAVGMIRIGWRITDIGLELGYADTANFIRAFRSWTGRSPSAYRQQIMANPDSEAR